mmetsp:Transcript_48815/g.81129  ORF Transcript_48815/g.81129 Transcript_48815/m.81129 type:complete len:235 (-) Transcript_48815:350-1054(-)
MGLFDLLGMIARKPPETRSGVAVTSSTRNQKAVMMPTSADALQGLSCAVRRIDEHFAKGAASGKSLEQIGNDETNEDIAVLVRGQLCSALSYVLLHGFKSHTLIGRYHIWDFVLQARDATNARLQKAGSLSEAERTFTDAVVEVNSLAADGTPANNPNIKFRSFVCSGLNHRLIHQWIKILAEDDDTMTKFYEPWAFVRKDDDVLSQMMTTLQPLSMHKYALSLDYETSRWDIT